MISVGINTICVSSSSQRKYNFKSKQNLKQFSTPAIKTNFDLSTTVKRKVKQILTNWCVTEQAHYNAANKAQPATSLNASAAAVQSLAATTKKKNAVTLLTLTITPEIAQQYTDKEIKRKYLNTFINYIKRQGTTHYFWIAEVQRSGNIHFHLIVNNYDDKFIGEWQKLTQNNTKYAATCRPVHEISKMIDYLLKGNNIRQIQGRIYGMSDNLKEFSNIVISNPISELTFYAKYSNQLTILFKEEYFYIAKPTNYLRSRIIKAFLLIRRRQ